MRRNYVNSILLVVAALCALAIVANVFAAGNKRGEAAPARGPQINGPDVICSEIFSYANWGQQNGIAAFSVGTRACNIGSESVSWRVGTPGLPDTRHPVIAQNIYRFQNGRFEQLGQSWLKHGFCAVDGDSMCLVCKETGDCNELGVGCSDPYAAELNGFQGSLGPRYQVNPSNGGFMYPPANPAWSGTVARRLQSPTADLPGIFPPPGNHYYVEVQYIAADDAIWNNDSNNVSYREVSISSAVINGFVGQTVAQKPAIYAWQQVDPQVQITVIDVPSDGRFVLAYRVKAVGRDYDYEFALYNMNSDKAGHAFVVPVRASLAVSNTGFRDVLYHSGEPYDNTDWSFERVGDELRWSGTPFANNLNANALRWGTMYNFRFRSNRPPRMAEVRVEMFKPNTPGFVSAQALTPTPFEDVNLDGLVNADDVMLVLAGWAGSGTPADTNHDGIVNVYDLFAVLSAWGS